MSGWLSHLVLGSTGLLLTALATALVLRAWRRSPLASYRLAVAVLAGALLLPAAQLVARSLGAPWLHPVRTWVEGLRRNEPAATEPVAVAVDGAPGAALDGGTAALDPTLLALLLLGQQAEQLMAETPAAGQADPEPRAPWVARLPFALGLVYALGVLASLLITARRLLSTRRLLRGARRVRDPRIQAIWREVAQGSPAGRRARLVESDHVRAPACSGLGRPVVVLPSGERLASRPDVLACVLTHELVHLERRDAWVQLGEELLRALFWFHPAAWWLRARLERLREVSCDLLVVRRTGKRKRYASALVEYAAWMQSGALGPGRRADLSAAVLPWSSSKGQLARRIEMLLENEPMTNPLSRWLAPAGVGVLFSFLWSGQLALAAGSAHGGGPEDVLVAADAALHDPEHEHEGASKQRVRVVRLEHEADGAKQDGSNKVIRIEVRGGDDGETASIVLDADEGIDLSGLQGHDTKKGKAHVVVVDGEGKVITRTLRIGGEGDGEHEIVVDVQGLHEGDAHGSSDRHGVVTTLGGLFQADGKKAKALTFDGRRGTTDEEEVQVIGIGGGEGGKQVLRWRAAQRGDEGGNVFFHDSRSGESEDCCQGAEVEVLVQGLRGDHDVKKPKTKAKAKALFLDGDGQVIEVSPGAEWTQLDELFGEEGGLAPEVHERIEAALKKLEKAKGDARFEWNGELSFGDAGDEHADAHEEHSERKTRENVFFFGGQDGAVRLHGGQVGKWVQRQGDGKGVVEIELDLEDLGEDVRRAAKDFHQNDAPEDLRAHIEKALELHGGKPKLSDEQRRGIERLHLRLQDGDLGEALEKAHEALQKLGNKELGEAAVLTLRRRADAAGASDAARKAFREAARERAPAPEGLEALKRELQETRNQLERQRAELDAMRAKLEALRKARGEHDVL